MAAQAQKQAGDDQDHDDLTEFDDKTPRIAIVKIKEWSWNILSYVFILLSKCMFPKGYFRIVPSGSVKVSPNDRL